MSRFPISAKTLRDYRTSFVSAGVVLLLMAVFAISIYPSYSEGLEGLELPSGLEGFLGEAESITSPEGFISAEFFSWIPLLLIVIAVIAGTGITAGDEAAGTLELLLAQPVSRRRVLLERSAGAAAGVILAALAGMPGFIVTKLIVDFDVSNWRLLAASINMIPPTLLFLAFSLWMSTTLPTRTAASTLSIGLVVATYVMNLVGSSVASLEWLRWFSPFYWSDASRVLIHGFDFARAGGLLVVGVLFLLLALRSFERRDIASGGRDWGLGDLFRGLIRRPAREEAAAGAESGSPAGGR